MSIKCTSLPADDDTETYEAGSGQADALPECCYWIPKAQGIHLGTCYGGAAGITGEGLEEGDATDRIRADLDAVPAKRVSVLPNLYLLTRGQRTGSE